jgi:uncharacterized protein with HEPN domain
MHYNNISGLVHQILTETQGIPYESFRKDEMLKERVFSQLQEIGQASREILEQTDPYDEDQELVEALSVLRNARFNQISEIELNSVWGIIQNDLPEIEEILDQKAGSKDEDIGEY